MSTDAALFEYVQRVINSGATRIVLPKSLVEGASREALETVRQLCNLNGVNVEGVKEDRGGCYLTTACVEHAGLADDCQELLTLRAFRDEYLLQQVGGPELVAEYYRTAPGIVAAIHRDPERAGVFRWVLAGVRSAVARVNAGDFEAATYTYTSIHKRLLARYNGGASQRTGVTIGVHGQEP
jgi:hypothetical protein